MSSISTINPNAERTKQAQALAINVARLGPAHPLSAALQARLAALDAGGLDTGGLGKAGDRAGDGARDGDGDGAGDRAGDRAGGRARDRAGGRAGDTVGGGWKNGRQGCRTGRCIAGVAPVGSRPLSVPLSVCAPYIPLTFAFGRAQTITASGIGGGGFMIIDPGNGSDAAFLDFREMAPAAAFREMYIGNLQVTVIRPLQHALSTRPHPTRLADTAPTARLADTAPPHTPC